MPTVLRQHGFSVRLYHNDHDPPHVHVVGANGVARIALGVVGDRPRLLSVVGLTRSEATDALRLIATNQELCLRRWREIHGGS
jgi:hypothetical protein